MEDLRIDPTIAYDVVELPSRGIHYPNNKKSVRVAYLTAADENILSAPNLINSNNLVPELIKRKVLDKDINTAELVAEDIQAILIFLRNTAFGSEYEVVLNDPKTNEEFKAQCDLSSLNFKPFELVADEMGEYSYFLEKSKTTIKFKFLNQKQEKEIEEIKKSWNGLGYPPIKTKELEFMIKSVNGNRDLMNINRFIDVMPITDSYDFRKFVNSNKPGLDLKQVTIAPSGEKVEYYINFGVEFFRPFFGI
jgi:hypothetical protein